MERHLEITGGVEQEVGGLQVAVQDVGRVDVLEASKDLVEEVADVVVAQVLSLEQLVQVCLHQVLDYVSAQLQVKEPQPQHGGKCNNVNKILHTSFLIYSFSSFIAILFFFYF